MGAHAGQECPFILSYIPVVVQQRIMIQPMWEASLVVPLTDSAFPWQREGDHSYSSTNQEYLLSS